jgi:hypothetical membrane protein
MADRPTAALTTDRRWAALGLVVGPVAFISAWLVGGARTPGYDPFDDAISRIAADAAPQQALMSAGFVVYGVALVVGALALHGSLLRRSAPAAVVNGLATLAVALTPLERSDAVDQAHGLAAIVGYVAIVAMPLLAIRPLRASGRDRAATASLVLAVVSAACLVASGVSDANGAFQRLGLLAGDVWLIATGLALWGASRRGRSLSPR